MKIKMNQEIKKVKAPKRKKVKEKGRKCCSQGCAKKLEPAYNVYANFCNETTLHGLKHTVAAEFHWFERLLCLVVTLFAFAGASACALAQFSRYNSEPVVVSMQWDYRNCLLWLVVTLFAFAGASACALAQFSRYNSEPVVVSMQRDYRSWWFTFPAITACFLDRVDVDKAQMIIEQNWNVTGESDPEKYQYYYEFIELISDVSFRANLQNFWRYQNDDTVKGIDLLQLALSVHPTQPLNVIVSQSNKEVQWIPVMTEVGMCMTFNSVYAQYQFTLSDVEWQAEDLLKCHYHSGQCFVRMDSLNNAVRYFVHSPFEISTAISNPTGEIEPGEELIMDFKVVEIRAANSIKSLRPDQRRCRYPDEPLSGAIPAYSFSLCQMHCRSRMAVMFCGCRPYFHVKGASLGGTTALFVGASVLTVVETGLFIIRQLVDFVLKLTTSSRVVEFKP